MDKVGDNIIEIYFLRAFQWYIISILYFCLHFSLAFWKLGQMCLICSTLSFFWKIHRSNVFTFKAIFNDFCFVIIWANFSRRFKKRCYLTDQAPGRLRVYLGQKLLYNFDSHLKWIVLNSFNKYWMILVPEYWHLDSLKRNKTSLVQSWLHMRAKLIMCA